MNLILCVHYSPLIKLNQRRWLHVNVYFVVSTKYLTNPNFLDNMYDINLVSKYGYIN